MFGGWSVRMKTGNRNERYENTVMTVMRKGNTRGMKRMIYSLRRNEILIPHKNFAQPNKMYEYKISISVS